MPNLLKRRFESPDDTRSFTKGKADLLSIGGNTLMLLSFEPGFKWSECIGPNVNSSSCQANHLWYVVSGRMHVKMDDGTEAEFGPGDVAEIPSGHDGWTVGNEPAVLFDMSGADRFAK